MWKYEKKLEYPVNITNKDLKMAKAMFAQYGGPDSELAAALRDNAGVLDAVEQAFDNKLATLQADVDQNEADCDAAIKAEKERAEKEANLQIKVKTIDEMTVHELKEYASKNNIDLGDVVIKADIIEVIKKTNLQ